ncbi:cation/H(+) antiporter 15-like [Salvia hispanica]|uniref:cation/H(+) antiporter 15-like n=1 Tax=Salvia hispanica TaxID=49212 RepID=UPI002009AD8E|nr:cation/H(+) antiporter 15-like [Salvia hispanica]
MAESANQTEGVIVCYAPTMISTNGIWQGDNPLDYSLPLFILQLTLVVVTTRILVFALKPLRQPRVVSEILGGIILGPSVLGRNKKFASMIFPLRSVLVLETIAHVGLLYFLFLVGVEMDMTLIKRTGKKAVVIAIAGMILPFLIGVFFAFVLHEELGFVRLGTLILFLGVALSVTSFSVLARILAELKLLNSDMGRLAMSSALINDMCAWVLLAVAIALAANENASLASLWVILTSLMFVLFCVYVVRPVISWVIQRTPEGESVNEVYICLILTGVMISAFITDALGTHSVFGAFVFGLVIPNGPFGMTLIEKMEDFFTGLLLPLFFAISGLKTDVSSIKEYSTWAILAAVIVLACAGKVAGTLLVTLYYKIPFDDGLTLGLLMNAKGLIEMIVLNVGKDQKVLDDEAFAIMVIVATVMTSVISPIITTVYKPAKKFAPYKRRTIQQTKQDGEFRVLVCVHTPKNVPTIINLLEASHPTKKSPICTYVLHLVELTGRSSAMLIVHNGQKSGRSSVQRTQSDHIIHAFENFQQNIGFISINPLTAISPYSTMDEDICHVAEDKHVALIIIPFHKQITVDGGMETTIPALRTINLNVLTNAPCSIGILVDRGLTGSTRLAVNQVGHHIAVLFIGGPDDREALAYAWRMSEHPGIKLTVVRFLPGEAGQEEEEDREKEKEMDAEIISEIRARASGVASVIYKEKFVNNGQETVGAIRSMEAIYDLVIVGRGEGQTSPLTAGLTDWSECPEMGGIGDLLASKDFVATCSVLVVQQYVGAEVFEEAGTPDSPSRQLHDRPFDLVRRTSPRGITQP